MAAYFFDTSGIVKYYVREVGTAWVQGIVDPAAGNSIHLARITGPEVVSAVVRRQRAGTLRATNAALVLAQFRNNFASQYQLIEITAALLADAMALAERHALRGYDAVQLAAALFLDAERLAQGLPAPTLVSADAALNAAAAAEGLAVEDPNARP